VRRQRRFRTGRRSLLTVRSGLASRTCEDPEGFVRQMRQSGSPAAGVPTASLRKVERDRWREGESQAVHRNTLHLLCTRHGADGCSRTGGQGCGSTILPPGWEGLDLGYVRPVFRQGSPFAIRDDASRGKRIVGGQQPPNGALKGAITTLPPRGSLQRPVRIPWPKMAMDREKKSTPRADAAA
jgi:hypothetical protein